MGTRGTQKIIRYGIALRSPIRYVFLALPSGGGPGNLVALGRTMRSVVAAEV